MRTLSLLALLSLTPLARADALDPAIVDAGAQILVHVDVDALQRTAIWEFVLERDGERIAEALADFEAEVGLDPLRDVRSITLYGTAERDQRWVALLRTSERLDQAVLALEDVPGYARVEAGGKTLHALEEGGRTWYGHAFRSPDASERLFAITEDRAAMLDAIAVVEGRRGSLAASERPQVAIRPTPGAALFVSASRRLGELGRFEPAAEVSRLLTGLVLEVGEADGDLFAELRLSTESEEDAVSVQQLAQGLCALGSLMSARAPEGALPRDVLRALRVDRTGSVVSLAFRRPATAVIQDLERIGAR